MRRMSVDRALDLARDLALHTPDGLRTFAALCERDFREPPGLFDLLESLGGFLATRFRDKHRPAPLGRLLDDTAGRCHCTVNLVTPHSEAHPLFAQRLELLIGVLDLPAAGHQL